jgi:hypothetical protein
MSGSTFLASEIAIGDLANKISIAPDGSMTFTDAYVPTVKLKDLINGGTIISNPSMVVTIEQSDTNWVALSANQYNQNFFKISVPYDWTVTEEGNTGVTILDENNKVISVESIQLFTSHVEITTTKKLNMKVVLKQIG